uniref:Uncharacterized protein n=1 Tax=Anguilla anguilla TaxID=7936 RepID=A0A0E9UMP9_ANGAN
MYMMAMDDDRQASILADKSLVHHLSEKPYSTTCDSLNSLKHMHVHKYLYYYINYK